MLVPQESTQRGLSTWPFSHARAHLDSERRTGMPIRNSIAEAPFLADTGSLHCDYFPSLDSVAEERSPENSHPFSELGDRDAESSRSSDNISSDSLCSSDAPDDPDDMEVSSSVTRGPLDSLSSLEASLPIKRGLSRFFSGKSRSFSCLTDVKSIKDIPKSENPYAKRRRNLVALGGIHNQSRFSPPTNTNRISKKPMHNNTKSTLALAVAMSNEESLRNGEDGLTSFLASPTWKNRSCPLRSFSLLDLQGIGCQISPRKASCF